MGLVAKAFQDIITFSRASSGTYVNSNGYITNSSVLNYLTYSNQPENAAWTKSNSFVQQNLLTYSEDFTNAAWAATDLTITANAAIAPNGTLTADLFTEGSGGTAKISQSITGASANATFCASINLARGNNDWYRILIYDTVTDTNRISAWVNLGTGAVGSATNGGTATGATVSMVSAGNGYYRIIVTGAVNNSVSALTYYIASANANLSATRVSGATVYAWGAQLVQGSVPGDYRATTSAALPCLYADYNGALRARKICEDAANSQHYWSEPTAVTAGVAYTVSFRVKAAEKTQIVYTWNVAGSAFNTGNATFNLSAGTVTSGGAATGTITALGSGWYLCTTTNTCVTTSAASAHYLAFTALTTYVGDGTSGVYIADVQVNDGSSALAYYDTTASAYNAPRFDYDPVTLAAKGLLVEESRANLVTYSSQIDDASWLKVGLLAFGSGSIANATLSPDGTVSADQITEDTSLGIHLAYKNNSVTAGVTYTLSFWVKRAVGTRDLSIRMDSGAATVRSYVNLGTGAIIGSGAGHTVTVRAWGSYWFVTCTMTAAATAAATMGAEFYNGATVTYTGDGTSALYVWGFQLEAGAFATSYIPTVASQVTRAADVASVNTLSPWYNSVAGTLYVEYDVSVVTGTMPIRALAAFSDGTTSNRIYQFLSNTSVPNLLVTDAGVAQASIVNSAISANVTVKTAATFTANDFALVTNGGTVATDLAGTNPTAIARLELGALTATATYLSGHLRRITYYPRRLTNAELQTLTTL